MYKLVAVASAACLLTFAFLKLPRSQSQDCPFPIELETVSFDVGQTPTLVAETLRQWIDWEGGSSYVQVGRHERSDGNAEWEFKEYMFSTDMKITDVGFAQGGQTLYVAGIRSTSSGCEDVIEQWDIVFPRGALVVHVPTAPPRGTVAPLPFRGTISSPVVVGGGAYVPPRLRPREPFVNKRVLYSGLGLGPFASIAADPEQRFLLAVSLSDGDLFSLSLTAPSAPTLEFNAAAIPHLASVKKIVAYEHQDVGRFYWLYETKDDVFGDGSFTFIVDNDNDGVFDSTVTLDSGVPFSSSPFNDDSKFVSLINTTNKETP